MAANGPGGTAPGGVDICRLAPHIAPHMIRPRREALDLSASHAPAPPDDAAPADRGASNALSLSARARANAAPRYLDALNAAQREAVEALDGPVLVLAGAGVGKTRVLTTRIAHLIATGRARPHEILSVTFTNKAAREMRERIGHLTGLVEGMPWMGTFHSIGAKILRRHAELVGLKPNFTILDTDDQIRLLKQVLQARNIDDKRWPARALAGLIDGWKNRGLDPAHVPPAEAAAFANGDGGALYALYQARLKALNAVDFGDLLLECLRLFRENAEVLRQYQQRLRYMLVDEYQDTNVVQYLWLRLLAQASRNLCCVGDDDQSIYGWRGADVDNILRFEHDFPGAKVIRLERNYRSGAHILAVAAGLIAHNQNRLGKTLFTEADAGEKPTVSGLWDSQEEARVIGDEIEAFQRAGQSLDEIAILVRASFQMREFEERFITLGLPYKVIGGPRFYERAEIRDALAYLRCVAQPDDDLAFERIFNVPKRGLGEATLNVLHEYARRAGVSLTRAMRVLIETEELKARPRQILRDFLRFLDRWSAQIDAMPHHELAQLILEESGYIDMWKADRTADAAGRLENLKELTRSMEEFPSPGRLPRACFAGDGRRERRRRRAGVDHDSARRQGPGVRRGVPAGMGGGPVSPSALARRERPRRPRRGAAARLCRADPRSRARRKSISPPTAAFAACGRPPSRRASSTNCRRRMSRSSRRRARRCTAAMRCRASIGSSRSHRATRRRAGGAPRSRPKAADLPRAATGPRHGPAVIEGRATRERRRRIGTGQGRAGLSRQVRPRQRRRGRRRQTDRRFRQGRPQDGAGELRAAGGVGVRVIVPDSARRRDWAPQSACRASPAPLIRA